MRKCTFQSVCACGGSRTSGTFLKDWNAHENGANAILVFQCFGSLTRSGSLVQARPRRFLNSRQSFGIAMLLPWALAGMSKKLRLNYFATLMRMALTRGSG